MSMPSAAVADSVVIITGASSGIGEACARRLARAGAKLVLAARRTERLTALCAELDPAATRTLVVACDVTDDADRRALVEAALKRFGRIDTLVNNAGYGQRGPVERVPVDAIRRNFETNVFSLVALTQLVAPLLRAQGHGRILNIGSVAGRIARPMSSIYDSTKHALEGLTDGLRGELKPFGVQVILVRPGFIKTEFGHVANAGWTEIRETADAYAPYIDGFLAKSKSLKRGASGVPDDIARAVEKALAARCPKSHYNAPGHASLFLFAKWLMPVCVMDYVLRMRKD
jgi:NAD(P)-dependent dehydrogenase (short-subunit alcohol dehydrogenase family)